MEDVFLKSNSNSLEEDKITNFPLKGSLFIQSNSKGIFRATYQPSNKRGLTLYFSDQNSIIQKKVLDWLCAYNLKNPPQNTLPFDFSALSTFQIAILQTLQQVPFGKTCSYQELAEKANYPKACRAVGNALNKNPFTLFIPCHRVIKSDQTLGGFYFGSDIKKALLQFEGAL